MLIGSVRLARRLDCAWSVDHLHRRRRFAVHRQFTRTVRRAVPTAVSSALGTNIRRRPVAGHSLREAVTSRAFILLYMSLVVIWIGASIPFVHLVPYAEDSGLSHGTAVTIFGLVGIGSIAGRFLLGGPPIVSACGLCWLWYSRASR